MVVPFVIACGACCSCSKSLFAACETINPQTGKLEGRGALLNKKNATSGAGLFGSSHLYGGCSAARLLGPRVPAAVRQATCGVIPINFDQDEIRPR